jgi:hypothetical protein
MKPFKNTSLGLAIALLATVGFVGCSGSAQKQSGPNFAQQSGASGSSSSSGNFARRSPRSSSDYGSQSAERSSRSAPSSSYSSSSSAPNSRYASSSSSSYANTAPSAQQQAPAPPPPIVLPTGTDLRVSVDQTISSATARPGQTFGATLLSPVSVGGQVVIPSNARVRARVVEARSSGRLSREALLVVTLDSVEINHHFYRITTDSLERTGASHKKRDIVAIGGGGALGAIIGGIVGGGKGAAIGAAAGAGAGTAGAALTGKKNVTLPVETTLIFRLTAPLSVAQ